MKKLKINKIICLTLCFMVFSSVAVSAKTTRNSDTIRSYSRCEVDPHPHESNPPF